MEVDFMSKLKATEGNKLDKLLLFGRVRCMIAKPDALSYINNDSLGAFAVLDVYGVKCLEKDYFKQEGIIDRYNDYNVFGSILIYLDKPSLVGKYVKVGGNSIKNGVSVKIQRTKAGTSFIVAFAWGKDGGNWKLNPNAVEELAVHDKSVGPTLFSDSVWKLVGENTALDESDTQEYRPFEGIKDYTVVDPSTIKSMDDCIHKSDERIDLSKIDLHLVYHETGVPLPEYFSDVKEDIEAQAEKRKEYAKELVKKVKDQFKDNAEVSLNAAHNIRMRFVNNIALNAASKVGKSSVKGKTYVEEFLKSLMVQGFSDDMKMSEKDMLALKADVETNPGVLAEKEQCGIKDYQFASIVIGISTGIGYGSLVRNYNSAKRVFTDLKLEEWFYMLLSNPYLLSIMGSSLNVIDADVIFYSYTKYFAVSICDSNGSKDMRNNLIYLKALEELSQDNSIIKKYDLKRFKATYGGSRYLNTESGFMVKKDLAELLRVICSANSIALSEKEKENLFNEEWRKCENSLISHGIVNTIDDDSLMLEVDVEKEALIFEVFQKKGSQETGITLDACEKVCDEFEEKVGFKLEPLQRKGISLIRYKGAVLTGCAGSGKTTTSDAMVIGLNENLKGYKMVYCAPTGKAARRMAEVLGKAVKTVHSEFKIGVGVGVSYLSKVDRRLVKKDKDACKGKIYLIDESGMLNRELLYEIARNITDNDIIYFLGDIKQLPPIGTGCPFYNLMCIMPCVELGVSKRAAEGSLINYNTTVINCLSDGVMEDIMSDDTSFIVRDCSNEAIAQNVLDLWRRFQSSKDKKGNPYTEDDIQVISAYADGAYSFSSTSLNPVIQNYLRRNQNQVLFRYTDKDFFKNERVIHTSVNLYGMQRFVKENGVYREVLTCGVVNGEMGKIIDCRPSKQYMIEELVDEEVEAIEAGDEFYEDLTDEDIEDLKDIREAYKDRMISVSSLSSDSTWLVDVEVYDVTLKRNVHIFYDGRAEENMFEVLTLRGNMIGYLELAYALSCHKMQGSQCKVVIIPIGSTANPSFCNRNMLNTEITRSQEVVCLVGDISRSDSVFNKGRTKVSSYKNDSLLSDLCDRAEELR